VFLAQLLQCEEAVFGVADHQRRLDRNVGARQAHQALDGQLEQAVFGAQRQELLRKTRA